MVHYIDYWVVNDRARFDKLGISVELSRSAPRKVRPLPVPVMTEDHQLAEGQKIEFVVISLEQALYYRDLFAHKMGQTAAEQCWAMIIDRKMFGVVGLHVSDWMRGRVGFETTLFEVFGFNTPLAHHRKVNRLLMMCLTSEPFMRLVEQQGSDRLRESPQILQTTCFTKYRKAKQNTGILELVHKQKEPNGLYRLVYRSPFHKRTWADCLKLYLDEEAKGTKE